MNYVHNEPNPTPPSPEELAARYAAAGIPAPKRKRVSKKAIAAVVVGLLAVIGMVSCTAAMFSAVGAADKSPVIMPDVAKPLGTATPTRRPVEKAPVNNLPRDGVLLVGKDLKPGTYQATCPEESVVGCYWARLKDTDGELTSVLANNVVSVGGTITLRVKTTDYAVEIRGGATWKRVR